MKAVKSLIATVLSSIFISSQAIAAPVCEKKDFHQLAEIVKAKRDKIEKMRDSRLQFAKSHEGIIRDNYCAGTRLIVAGGISTALVGGAALVAAFTRVSLATAQIFGVPGLQLFTTPNDVYTLVVPYVQDAIPLASIVVGGVTYTALDSDVVDLTPKDENLARASRVNALNKKHVADLTKMNLLNVEAYRKLSTQQLRVGEMKTLFDDIDRNTKRFEEEINHTLKEFRLKDGKMTGCNHIEYNFLAQQLHQGMARVHESQLKALATVNDQLQMNCAARSKIPKQSEEVIASDESGISREGVNAVAEPAARNRSVIPKSSL